MNKGYEQWVTQVIANLAGHFNFDGWRIEVEHKEEEREVQH